MPTSSRTKYLIILSVLSAGYFTLFYYPNIISDISFCIFKSVTDVPCPACGSTRATMLLFQGDVAKSIFLNPIGLLLNSFIAVSVFWIISDFVRDKNSFLKFLTENWSTRVKIGLLALIIINWIWNIEKGL